MKTIAAALILFLAQLPLETGTARVSGIVLLANPGAPASPGRRAIVTITGSALPVGKSVITDDSGHFVLDRLPAGRFMLTATKAAYLPGAYGATRPGRPGVPLALAAGDRLADLSITLTHGAAIGGTIRDNSGAPVFGITVAALRVLPDGSLTTAATVFSDDRGIYRLFALPAGDYFVSASRATGVGGEVTELTADQIDRKLAVLRAGRSGAAPAPAPPAAPAPISTSSFAPVFHPRAFSPTDAAKLTLAYGEDRSGADIVLDRLRAVTVEGTVSGAPAGAAITIAMTQSGVSAQMPSGGPALRARSPGDGPFQFGNVTPGHYTVSARTSPAAGPVLFAQAEIDVTGNDVRGVALAMQPALHLRGRIVFDASRLTPPADLSTIRVMLEDATPRPAAVGAAGGGRGSAGPATLTTDARGNFDVDGVLPGTYRISTTLMNDPAGWWLRSGIVSGRDVLDAPLSVDASTSLTGAVLTFSDRHTTLSGKLDVPAGRTPSDYYIVVFPEERAMWLPRARRIQSARPATDGAYLLRDLPPGAYRLAALTDVSADDLLDRAFFEALLPASIPISLSEGEQKVQALKVGGSAATHPVSSRTRAGESDPKQ
jgi:carboxypeptidase family protein